MPDQDGGDDAAFNVFTGARENTFGAGMNGASADPDRIPCAPDLMPL